MAGTASDQLFGTCEGLWEPDLVCCWPTSLLSSRVVGERR